MVPVEINEEMNLQYNDILNKSREICRFLRNKCLESIMSDARSEFNRRLKARRGLPSFDEKIFDYYLELIAYYKRASKLYSGGRAILKSERLSRLLEGLNSVLKARISQFDECTFGNNGENPVKREKQKIIDSFVLRVNEEIICLDFEGFFRENLFNDKIKKLFNDKFSKKINEVLNSEAIKCHTLLNDIEKRECAALYYDMLKEEKEILTSVIRVQADALEGQEQTGDEEMLVQSILLQLREAYQYMNKHIDTISEGFMAAESGEKDFFKDFEPDERALDIQIVNEINKIKAKTGKLAIAVSRQGERREEELKAKSDFNSCVELCESFIEAFNGIGIFYEDIKTELKKSNESDIADGIYETVRIKIDSLKDGLACLKAEYNTELEKNNNMELNEAKSIRDEIIDSLGASGDGEGSHVLINILLNIREKEKTKSGGFFEKIHKKLFNFKKEQLLFEITTFEEIMSYSVSRLRKSENTAVMELVAAIDFGVEEIKGSLDKFGIEVIRPKSHEMFNAKEHEVLMAEKNPEFKKGEIIKVMNSGFKENTYVIIRANVIAAK